MTVIINWLTKEVEDKMKDKELIEKLKNDKLTMITYLKMKLDEGDFHGVQDAASDIREIDAKLVILRM